MSTILTVRFAKGNDELVGILEAMEPGADYLIVNQGKPSRVFRTLDSSGWDVRLAADVTVASIENPGVVIPLAELTDGMSVELMEG